MVKHKISSGIVLLVSVLLFTYIATKATVSSFTHDESYSYLHYISQSFMDILSNQGAFSNNHVLNTLGMKYSEMLFGNSEVALRLPNLIMLLVFFTYTFLLFRKTNPVLFVSVFILVTANTVLIDFFGLARGYGISIGFMIMGLYHLIAAFNGNTNKNLVLFNISAMLAILSNFTMLSFYVSALLVYNLTKILECRIIAKERFSFWKTNRTNVILFFFLLLVLYEPVRKAIKFNTFNFGGKQGFVTDTVTSLIYHIFTNAQLSSLEISLLQISMTMIILGSLLVIILKLVHADKDFFIHSRALIVVNFLLLTISVETIVQHHLLKTDYLVGRFSLFLLPLFVMNVGFLFDYLSKLRYRVIVQGIAVSLAMLSVSNFYLNRDLYSCADWGYDMETKNVVTALINDHKQDTLQGNKVKLGVNWLFEPTVNFYRQTLKLHWLIPADRNGLTETDDYDYIFMADTGQLKSINHRPVFSSEKTKSVLVKNQRSLTGKVAPEYRNGVK